MDQQTGMDRLCLIDVSAEDDSLISTTTHDVEGDRTPDFCTSPATKIAPSQHDPPSTQQCLSSLESIEGGGVNEKHSTLNEDVANCQQGKKGGSTSLGIDKEQLPVSEEPSQPRRRKRTGQCNLRKSLAWDKAFFTDEGVLNPVELSLVNRTFKKPNERSLPAIEEEEPTRTSLDSNCSFGSDDLALQDLEEKLFTEPQLSINKAVDGVGKTHNAACSEPVSIKPQGPRQSNTKPPVFERRNIGKKVAESTSQIRSCSGLPTSLNVKKSSNKNMEELQKADQSKDATVKNCSPAPTVVTENVYTAHKRVKYTHGNILPANWARASGHRISPGNIKNVFGFRNKCTASSNSSAADSVGSANYSVLYSPSPSESLEKPRSEMPTEFVSETACLNNDKKHSGISSVRSLDGMPAAMFSAISTDLAVNLNSKGGSLHSHEFTPSTGVSISAESLISQCSRKNHRFENSIQAHPPNKDASNMSCNIGKSFLSSNAPSSSGSCVTGSCRSKPSGLRMPSPKLGFFDPAKVICAQQPSALPKRSTGSRVLPPKSMPRGTGKLKPRGVPCGRPTPTVTTSSSFPSYTGIIPSSIPRPDTNLKSFISSIPAPSFQSQFKSKPEATDLVLLAQQKFCVSSKAQQVLSDERSDQKQASLNASQAEAAVTTVDLEDKLQEVNQHNQKGSNGSVTGECQVQLDFSEGKFTSQDLSNTLCSESIYANTNSTEALPVAETGKSSDINEVIDIQPDHQRGMALLNDVTLGDSVSQAVIPERLPSPREGETENLTKRDISEECQPQLDSSEGKSTLQDISNGKCSEAIEANTTGTEINLSGTGKATSMNESINLQPGHHVAPWLADPVGGGCQAQLDFSEGKFTLQDVPNILCSETIHTNTNHTEISAVTRTGKISNMSEVIGLQLGHQLGTTLFANATIGNSASQLVKLEQLPSPNQGKTENITEIDISEEFHISTTSSLETCSDLMKNEQWAGACRHVSVEIISKQNVYSGDKVKDGIADVDCGLQLENVAQCNPKEFASPLDDLVNSNTKKVIPTEMFNRLENVAQCNPKEFASPLDDLANSNTKKVIPMEMFNSPSQRSDRPVHEDASSFLGQISNDKVDSSPVCAKFSPDSVFGGVQIKSNSEDAIQEIKPTGRNPLAVNDRLLNAPDQGFSHKHMKENNNSVFAMRRFSSSSVTSHVLGDIPGQENITLEGQHADGLFHKSHRRKSLDSLSDKNPFNASPFSEEWICALESAGEEWLQMKRGPVQNSPPDKVVPQPGPWSPVRRNSQQLGPFDCTKYTNASGSNGMHHDQ